MRIPKTRVSDFAQRCYMLLLSLTSAKAWDPSLVRPAAPRSTQSLSGSFLLTSVSCCASARGTAIHARSVVDDRLLAPLLAQLLTYRTREITLADLTSLAELVPE